MSGCLIHIQTDTHCVHTCEIDTITSSSNAGGKTETLDVFSIFYVQPYAFQFTLITWDLTFQ